MATPEVPITPHLMKLNAAIEGTLVDVAAFRAVFTRIEQSYGEAARALDRALERLQELTDARDALLATLGAEALAASDEEQGQPAS